MCIFHTGEIFLQWSSLVCIYLCEQKTTKQMLGQNNVHQICCRATADEYLPVQKCSL